MVTRAGRGGDCAAMSLPHARPGRPGAWLLYLLLGVVGIVVHAVLTAEPTIQSLTYDAVGATAVGAALVAIALHRPARVAPWLLITLGQASFVAGDLAWNVYEFLGEDPFPSLADVLYLAGYPLIAAGLLLLIRHRIAGGDRGGILDAAILTTAVAIVSWTFLMQPQVAASEVDALSLVISLAYPVGDLILIGVALGLLTTPGARTVSFRFLAGSLVLLLLADHVYALQTLDETYVSGGPIDAVYLASYVLFGVAALHPTMRRLTDARPANVTWLGPIRLSCLALAGVTGPLLVAAGPEANDGLVVVAAGTALLSLLVLLRLTGLVGLLEQDVAQRKALEAQLLFQAHHDPLTGLANRRRYRDATAATLAGGGSAGRVAVLFLDLDDFKLVNDGLGHRAGDELLVAVAERIGSITRPGDVAARLGGDEFAVLLRDVAGVGDAVAVGERLLATFEQPIAVAGRDVRVGASIGIATDVAGADVDLLLAHADVAMYRAKARGKDRLHVFGPEDLEDFTAPARARDAAGSRTAPTAPAPHPRLDPRTA